MDTLPIRKYSLICGHQYDLEIGVSVIRDVVQRKARKLNRG